jgi:WD40 repeat protein
VIKTGDANPTTAVDQAGETDEPTAELSFDDSTVFKYACSHTTADTDTDDRRGRVERPTGASLVGFRASTDTLLDPNLRKIYSISFHPFREHALIAAGGHQGHVSIYPSPVSASGSASGSASAEPEDEGVDEEDTPPLMSFRAHRGWVSSLSLALGSAKGANLLLSAANDGMVKLWNLNQSARGEPKEVMSVDDLHRTGIFGMDVSGDGLVTCSKDATIAVSRFQVNASALTMVRRYEDHESVVKCARFSPVNGSCIASGGNDRCLRIYDTRSSANTASQSVKDAHVRAINSVVWHPTQDHVLLSASFDPEMHLYDLRHAATPLHVLGTSISHTASAIYHPCFIADGAFVVSTGAGSQDQLSLHRTQDGSIVSRGQLPSKASYIACDPWSGRLVVAMGPQLQFFQDEWRAS